MPFPIYRWRMSKPQESLVGRDRRPRRSPKRRSHRRLRHLWNKRARAPTRNLRLSRHLSPKQNREKSLPKATGHRHDILPWSIAATFAKRLGASISFSLERMESSAVSAGYSGTPLVKKLGIVAGSEVLVLGAPADFNTLLLRMPAGVRFTSKPTANTSLAHVFVTEKAELSKSLAALRQKLDSNAPVWVSWPKKSSGVSSNVTEDVVRQLALPLGYVDIKVCAVSDVWSGLKLVVRKELR
jgi:hypothetical protein